MYLCLQAFPQSLQLFFHVVYLSIVSVIIYMFPYFALKLFCFLRIRLLVCLRTFFPYLLGGFSFVVLKCPVLYELFHSISFFASTFWFISSSCILCSNHVALLFSSRYILTFFPILAFLLVLKAFSFVFPV